MTPDHESAEEDCGDGSADQHVMIGQSDGPHVADRSFSQLNFRSYSRNFEGNLDSHDYIGKTVHVSNSKLLRDFGFNFLKHYSNENRKSYIRRGIPGTHVNSADGSIHDVAKVKEKEEHFEERTAADFLSGNWAEQGVVPSNF